MKKFLTGKIAIHAPAETVWEILGRRYSEIGTWARVIAASRPIETGPLPDGSDASARECVPAMPLVSTVEEELMYFEDREMRFGYRANSGLPGFITMAENNWSVEATGPATCIVRSDALLELRPFPGLFFYPIMKWQMDRAGAQLFEDLKYYAENGKPHPKK